MSVIGKRDEKQTYTVWIKDSLSDTGYIRHKGFTSRAEARSYIEEGDIIGYWDKDDCSITCDKTIEHRPR